MTALPRQQTMRALVDWSYDLLTPQEQLLFARLGVFAGGFGLDAATAVCGGEGLDEIDIFDLLTSLTDKSLVVADTSGERERYRLLESHGAPMRSRNSARRASANAWPAVTPSTFGAWPQAGRGRTVRRGFGEQRGSPPSSRSSTTTGRRWSGR